MELLKIGLLGAIQGLTEFLPISSSGHLIVFRDWLGVEVAQPLAFDVALHLGTLMALVLFFFQELKQCVIGWVLSIRKRSIRTPEQRLPWLILVGTLPAVFAGYFFEAAIEESLRKPIVVAVMLILIGLLMIAVERKSPGNQEITQVSFLSSLMIGVSQAIALIPGTSRSGITIITGMQQKLKRVEAARFSFLLSVPAIVGAAVKQAVELRWDESILWTSFAMGAFSSAIVGWIGLKFLMKFLSEHSLVGFAFYRFGLAFVIIFTLVR